MRLGEHASTRLRYAQTVRVSRLARNPLSAQFCSEAIVRASSEKWFLAKRSR